MREIERTPSPWHTRPYGATQQDRGRRGELELVQTNTATDQQGRMHQLGNNTEQHQTDTHVKSQTYLSSHRQAPQPRDKREEKETRTHQERTTTKQPCYRETTLTKRIETKKGAGMEITKQSH